MKFIFKDTNVNQVALACQCTTGLAKGLRNNFKQHANNNLSVCLEKFKEKKLGVVTALRDCVDAFYNILGVDQTRTMTKIFPRWTCSTVTSVTSSSLLSRISVAVKSATSRCRLVNSLHESRETFLHLNITKTKAPRVSRIKSLMPFKQNLLVSGDLAKTWCGRYGKNKCKTGL